MNQNRTAALSLCAVLLTASAAFADNGQKLPIQRQMMTDSTFRVTPTVQLPPSVREVAVQSRVAGIQGNESLLAGNAAKMLLTRHFSPSISRSSTISPKVTILGKAGNRIQAEALYVFLDRHIYTATLSKVIYDLDGDKVTLRQKIDNFTPPITAMQTPATVNPAAIKIKADILKNLKMSLPQAYGPRAIANTPCNDIPTAVSFTNQIHGIFTQAFGSASKLIGSQSTKTTLMDVLHNGTNLVAWNNIGHGNPDLIVQWNGEVISSADFNTSTPFHGIYNSVILLNSCSTCAAPYSLKNGIMKHKPRTYIAGSKNLPIGSSEEVDKIFWDYTLLQNQNMAWSLNEAQKRKNLLGYFCLVGYNGKFAEVEAAKFTEDCISFNPNMVSAAFIQGHWKVIHGNMSMMDYGTNKTGADKAVQTIKQYGLNKQCFVGRPNAPMQYYTVNGRAPVGPVAGEDCISFNPASITAAKVQGNWKVVQGNMWMMDFGQKEAEAKIAVEIIKFYGFNKQCFVGRPNAPMQYYRK